MTNPAVKTTEPFPADVQHLAPYLDYVLAEAKIDGLPNYYRGKVRENYDLPDGRRILIASDRLSAFDVNLAVIPFKGQALTEIARFWFEETKDICKNHVLAMPDPNVMVGKKLKMLPVEIVVRDYLAGTTSTAILSQYKKGVRSMYGEVFADGMRDNQKLPRTIITPTTKAEQGAHDAPLSPQQVVEEGHLPKQVWEEVSAIAFKLFARGKEIAAKRGLILVDTKYEFGFDDVGHIVLADEVHTPDSSRYWRADNYEARFAAGEKPESLDKDFIRTWVSSRCDPYKDTIPPIPPEMVLRAAKVYMETCALITGKPFTLPPLGGSVLARIKGNLEAYLKA